MILPSKRVNIFLCFLESVDYTPIQQVFQLSSSQLLSVDITILDDGLFEPQEFFTVVLSHSFGDTDINNDSTSIQIHIGKYVYHKYY